MPPRSCSIWRMICLKLPFSVADQVVGRHPTSSKITSQKWSVVGHVEDRPDLDAGLCHVDDELRQPAWGGGVGVGAGDQVAPVGVGGAGGPHLLPVEHPVVAVALGPGAQRGHVAAGVGLAHADAPHRRAGDDLGEEAARCCSSVPNCSSVGPIWRSENQTAPAVRLRRSAPRTPRTARAACDRRRRTRRATSCRATRCAPARATNSRDVPRSHESSRIARPAAAARPTSSASAASATSSGGRSKSIGGDHTTPTLAVEPRMRAVVLDRRTVDPRC